ncbi:MAG: putative zinc-type alcohol dehydrogenase-like protein [Ferruginibacter sp.]|nr:putative zinc-type alcohol dehydrogenase-like protein [Ferruginibacter sp.]
MSQTKESPVEDLTSTRLPSKGYAAMATSGNLVPWNFTRRNPRPHDVLVDIKYCGICHTDIHFVRNDFGMSVYPLVPGHEIVGVVTAVGDAVIKFKTGDTVGIGCLVDSCRECDNCKQDLEQYCLNGATYTYSIPERHGDGITYGGYSNQIVCDEDFVLKVDGSLPQEKVAPLLCAGITTYSPLRNWDIGAGHKVAILGLGGLGHMGVKFAAAMGAEVTVLSTSPEKEADAMELGAHKFVFTKDEEQVKNVQGYFDFILDTVAAEHDYNFYLSMLKTKGTMVCVGLPNTPAQVPVASLVFFGRSLAGSLIGGIAETQKMLDFCAANNITADIELINIKDVNEAFERIEQKDVKYRFVIDMATL